MATGCSSSTTPAHKHGPQRIQRESGRLSQPTHRRDCAPGPVGCQRGLTPQVPGGAPKVVSERLGHASIAITLDTYSHVLPTLQEEAARDLDTWLPRRA